MQEFIAYCDIVKGVKQPKAPGSRQRIPDSLTMADDPPWEPPILPLCPLHGVGTICDVFNDTGECCVLWDTPRQSGSWRQYARLQKRHYIGEKSFTGTFELALHHRPSSASNKCDELLFQPRIQDVADALKSAERWPLISEPDSAFDARLAGTTRRQSSVIVCTDLFNLSSYQASASFVGWRLHCLFGSAS
jgi:hypothetical protein